MAKKKKSEPLVGMSRDPENKLTVQKSRPLTALWQSELSLAEFKILDAYLARINSKNPDQRTIELPKGELERALGVKRINREDLKQRLKHLSQGVDLEPESKKKVRLVTLFEEAYAEQDDNGIWNVRLTCTPTAMKYFFNVEKLGYLRYKLRCITSLTSRYTYILFIYLESNRFRESWEVDLEELKQILNCHEDSLYDEYKRFNERILKRCQKELADKTECRFTYEPVRKGRTVAAIRFKLELLSPKIEANEPAELEQVSVFDDDDEFDPEQMEDLKRRENRERRETLLGRGFDNELFDEFTDEELLELKDLAYSCAERDDVDELNKVYKNRKVALEHATANFIVQKIKAMNVYSKRSQIKKRYNYLKTSILKEKKDKKEKEG